MMHRARSSGISVPLFSLRSSHSWGIGEIGDIPAVASWLRSASQSVLQILPLNELAPSEASPYSALSAMAIDPQFVSIGLLDEGTEFDERMGARTRRPETVASNRVRQSSIDQEPCVEIDLRAILREPLAQGDRESCGIQRVRRSRGLVAR